MPAILDVAIGTVFIFLLFSIAVTALNEIWLSFLDKRAAFLKEWLEELLKGDTGIDLSAFFGHGLISSLSRGVYKHLNPEKRPGFLKQLAIAFLPRFICRKLGWTLGTVGVPSYIPGKSFVLTLLSFVDDVHAQPRALLARQIEQIRDLSLRHSLSRLITSGNTPASLHVLENLRAGLQKVLDTPAASPTSAASSPHNPAALAFLQSDAAILQTLPALLEGVKDLREQIAQGGENSRLHKTLLALYDDAAGDLEKFKANIENWFNQSMDRVSGWYKRYAQQWLFALSLILAVCANVDTVQIVRLLSTDEVLRESLVKQAEQHVEDQRGAAAAGAGVSTVEARGSSGTTIVINATANSAPSDPAVPLEPEPVQVPTEADLQKRLASYKKAIDNLGGTGLPLGWDSPHGVKLSNSAFQDAPSLWLSAILGWFLTALAASLGAPFWFDTLNRFIDLRGVGRAPEEKDPTAPKKKITGDESYLEKSTPSDAR